ncbi:hypothetical protein HC931_03220 [Candidatus Gracilibacteria bacterium]|nr:hypothetical protein [Candidatus Gracilibacteria bacterium]NJM86585.1 hypothetical protein [Hydrococcus sp. RU_2_2]NJP18871.1 hypothetical protein [Hydrococcus sp. CRU_1_1]
MGISEWGLAIGYYWIGIVYLTLSLFPSLPVTDNESVPISQSPFTSHHSPVPFMVPDFRR